MKKICFVLFFILFNFLVFAQDYGIPNSCFSYVYGYGKSGAVYDGNTKNLTLEEVHKKRVDYCIKYNEIGLEPFSGKFSQRQITLVNNALFQYQLEVGEIYSVGFYEASDFNHFFGITVRINKVNGNGSIDYTWMGFSYYNSL